MRLSIALPSACLLYLFLCSCEKLGLCRDGKLQIPVTEYTGNNLRTDGYYSKELLDTVTTRNSVEAFILYRNGVSFNTFVQQNNDGSTRASWNWNMKGIRHHWGAFLIEGQAIDLEDWDISISTCNPLRVFQGTILNDTTFVLTSQEEVDRKKKENKKTISDTFRFFRLDAKPDSLNDFVP